MSAGSTELTEIRGTLGTYELERNVCWGPPPRCFGHISGGCFRDQAGDGVGVGSGMTGGLEAKKDIKRLSPRLEKLVT